MSVLCVLAVTVKAQLHGVITDSQTGDTILYPSASYKGNHVAVSGNAEGYYSIARHNGWYLTFSAVGYESKVGGLGKYSGNYGKGKAISFNGQIFESLTLLAKYLKENVEVFKDKEEITIIKGISKNSKRGTKYCGYEFHRL